MHFVGCRWSFISTSPSPYLQPSWQNRLIRSADKVVVPSTDAAERWTNEASLDPADVCVIPTGVDTNRFVPIPDAERARIRSELGVAPGTPMVLFAGRIDPGKGLDVLMEATHELDGLVHLVVCGSATDAGYLARLKSSSRGRQVSFVERRPDITTLLASADLVVLPSVVPETQGLVVAEAMSSGTPAIASNIGGLVDSLAGFPSHLVPAGDAGALARSVRELADWRISDPDLGQRSRSWVVDHLSLERSIGAVTTLFAELGPR